MGNKRIKKLYFIHIITFVASILIKYDWIVKFDFTEICFKGILNLMLIQSLFPDHAMSFNGATWFLSTIFICYIFALPLIVICNNLKKLKTQSLIILVWTMQVILFFIISNIDFMVDYKGWFFYISPCFRISDFFRHVSSEIIFRK